MADKDKTVLGIREMLIRDTWVGIDVNRPRYQRILNDALILLKEQDSEKKRIMKVIWDALHEGFSIDTIADQDWVYEQIRHRIEDV